MTMKRSVLVDLTSIMSPGSVPAVVGGYRKLCGVLQSIGLFRPSDEG